MKKFYISNFHPFHLILLLLLAVQPAFTGAFAAPQQAGGPGFRSTDAVKRVQPRPRRKAHSDSLAPRLLQKALAASRKRHPAKSLAEMRALKANGAGARKSATADVPAILYVNINKDSGPPYDGTSWENAFEYLGDALKYAYENEGVQQIWVANGIYNPTYDPNYIDEPGDDYRDQTFTLVPNVMLYGGFKGTEQSLAERKINTEQTQDFDLPDENLFTILDGGDFAYHTVTSAGAVGSAGLDGFVIAGGVADGTSDASVRGIAVPRNVGGGIVIANSSPSLSNLQIMFNKAENGGGVYMTGSSSALTNLQLFDNRSTNGSGIYAAQSASVLTNSIIHDNRAEGAGAVYLINSSDVLTNLTIAENRGTGAGGVLVDGGAPKIRNTIVSDNTRGSDIDVEVVNGGVPSFAYSFVAGSGGSAAWNAAFGTDLGGNLDGESGMYNPGGGLFGLYPGAPTTNVGNNLYFQAGQTPDLSGITADLRGTPRIMKETIDIAALESLYGVISSNLTPNEDRVLFVKKGGSGLKNGSNWDNAAAELADAVFASNIMEVSQIWVAGGIYHPLYRPDDLSNANPKSPHNAFLLLFNTELYGGFKGDETSLAARNLALTENASILSGDFDQNDNFSFADLRANGLKAEFSENARHVVFGAHMFSRSALDGFTIEGANNTSAVPGEMLLIDEAFIPAHYGAGIFIHRTDGSEVDYRNLIIRNNLGSQGGGFTAHQSESLLENSLVYHNYDKGYGSGVLDVNPHRSLKLNSITVAQNLSTGEGPLGAAIGCIGGDYLDILNSIITDNILLGDDDSRRANVSTDLAEAYFANCIIQGSGGSANWQWSDFSDDGGNLDVDPQFTDMNAGNFSLAECSRAIDAGDIEHYRSEEEISSTDIGGKTRISNNRIDIGAFEFQGARSPEATALAGNAEVSTFTFGSAGGNTMHTFTAEGDVCDSDLLTLNPGNLSGLVNAKVWVDAQVNSYAGAVYLQRHFDIEPAVNPETSTGRVVLYFTQAEFDALNLELTPPEYLPTGAPDGEYQRKENIRIYQFHGVSSDGSGSPASYGNTRTVIDPDESDINWNAALNRWEVAFTVDGFSGFFAGTVTQNPLPVRVVSFEGKLSDDRQVKLDWKVAEQENILVYEVEYSKNAKAFTKIGQVAANALASTDYTFTDTLRHTGEQAYYRLKIIEADGKTAYSKLVSVKLPANEGIVAYPVPAKNEFWIDWKASDATSAELIDANGRVVGKIRKLSASQKIDISAFPAGTFFLQTNGNDVRKIVKSN